MEVILEGADAATDTTRSSAEAHAVTPRYFQTMGIPLLQGQDFATPYRSDQPLELMVSESFAHRYWPNESAIGKRFRAGPNNPFGTIVGVVGDVRTAQLAAKRSGGFLFSLRPHCHARIGCGGAYIRATGHVCGDASR
jgi:hypothetical protein